MNSAGVMVMASMGRRVSHPTAASDGRRRGCRLRIRASLWVVAVCASGSVSAHVYDAMTWTAFNTVFRREAMPPHRSTKWMGLCGKRYLGMHARGGDDEEVIMGKVLVRRRWGPIGWRGR